jgi:glutamyl-tRNA synthetase
MGLVFSIDEEELRKYLMAIALENAISHEGRPSFDAVVKKLLGSRPEYRKVIRDIIPIVRDVIDYVGSLEVDMQKRLFEDYATYLPEKVVKKREKPILPPLPEAKRGEVVTRFAPNPDFVLHLGSLRPLILSYEYAKMYDGKFILRFEDTDPRIKKPEPEYYDLILEDLEWLGIVPDEVYYQSDRLELYYDVAMDLIEKGYAYVCLCERTYFSKLVRDGVACPHRESDVDENIALFKEMLDGGFGEGEAVLRIKSDISHPNPSLRDFALLRIIDTERYPHPRVGSSYRVWPLYNFSVTVDDHYMGVTHILRGEEHRVNEEKQRFIYLAMGWKPPIGIHHGRLAIFEGVLSKSKILRGIKEGLYKGYDDPRLFTLVALRRRGIHPDALRNIILSVGIKTTKAIIDWSLIVAENKKIIDPISNRYYGVRRPFHIRFGYPGVLDIKIRRHPDYPDRGYRVFRLGSEDGVYELLIDFEDSKYFVEGSEVRLLHIGNFFVKDVSGKDVLLEYVDNDVKRAVRSKLPFIHWVYDGYSISANFIYPDSEFDGLVEKGILDEERGSWVQLERLGYFRIDNIGKESVELIFTHE